MGEHHDPGLQVPLEVVARVYALAPDLLEAVVPTGREKLLILASPLRLDFVLLPLSLLLLEELAPLLSLLLAILLLLLSLDFQVLAVVGLLFALALFCRLAVSLGFLVLRELECHRLFFLPHAFELALVDQICLVFVLMLDALLPRGVQRM
jgi:hypothetical protein